MRDNVIKKIILLTVLGSIIAFNLTGCAGSASNDKNNTNSGVVAEKVDSKVEVADGGGDVGKTSESKEPTAEDTQITIPTTDKEPSEYTKKIWTKLLNETEKAPVEKGLLTKTIAGEKGDISSIKEVSLRLTGDMDLTELLQAKSLEKLTIGEDRKNSKGYLEPIDLSSLTNLKEIRINSWTLLNDLSQLNLPTSIEKLYISASFLEYADSLASLPNLKEIYLNGTSVKTIPNISSLESISWFAIDQSYGKNAEFNLSEEAKSSLLTAPRLKNVILNGWESPDYEFLNSLTNAKSLNSLSISSNSFKDLSWVTKISKLPSLTVGGSNLVDMTIPVSSPIFSQLTIAKAPNADLSNLKRTGHTEIVGEINNTAGLAKMESMFVTLGMPTQEMINAVAKNENVGYLTVYGFENIDFKALEQSKTINTLVLGKSDMDLSKLPDISTIKLRGYTEEQLSKIPSNLKPRVIIEK